MHHCHPCAAQPYGVAPAGYGPGFGPGYGYGGFTLIVVLFILLVIVGWGGFLGTTA